MVDIAAIVGPINMTPAAEETVIDVLREFYAEPLDRRFYYARWCALMGLTATSEQLARVSIIPFTRL